jgi:hypothetical protein
MQVAYHHAGLRLCSKLLVGSLLLWDQPAGVASKSVEMVERCFLIESVAFGVIERFVKFRLAI